MARLKARLRRVDWAQREVDLVQGSVWEVSLRAAGSEAVEAERILPERLFTRKTSYLFSFKELERLSSALGTCYF
jgi:hypothetical protein